MAIFRVKVWAQVVAKDSRAPLFVVCSSLYLDNPGSRDAALSPIGHYLRRYSYAFCQVGEPARELDGPL